MNDIIITVQYRMSRVVMIGLILVAIQVVFLLVQVIVVGYNLMVAMSIRTKSVSE